MNTVWDIIYTDETGSNHTTEFLWSERKPSANDVAIGIRDQLLADIVLVDRTTGEGGHSVALLEHYGFRIISIEKALGPTL